MRVWVAVGVAVGVGVGRGGDNWAAVFWVLDLNIDALSC